MKHDEPRKKRFARDTCHPETPATRGEDSAPSWRGPTRDRPTFAFPKRRVRWARARRTSRHDLRLLWRRTRFDPL